jgi:aminodeoxyfutalosine deaminase
LNVSAAQLPDQSWFAGFRALPKAELHVHLEGSIEPSTAVVLGKRYGASFDEAAVRSHYATHDFAAFIEAYKWVTSYLRAPEDYALVAHRLAEQLLSQNVAYAEVTLSAGVMLLRKQDVAANFRAVREIAKSYESRGLRLQWIFDAVRQFGAAAAREVAKRAVELHDQGVVAFGMGGDELAVPASEFRDVYNFVTDCGLRRLVHAGEIGGPESVRDAVELLGAERIGHGIAAVRDPRLMSMLAERAIHLEICPTSNLRTGAGSVANMCQHPLPKILRAGVPLSVSTDDPAMFETNLNGEYQALGTMGLNTEEILRVAEGGFAGAFLPAEQKADLLERFRNQAAALGLL